MPYWEFVPISASAGYGDRGFGEALYLYVNAVLLTQASKDPSLEESNCMYFPVDLKC